MAGGVGQVRVSGDKTGSDRRKEWEGASMNWWCWTGESG